MVNPGDIVIVHDPDLRDMYCARALLEENEVTRNILVEILYMIRYPIQHAVLSPDRANENVPLHSGCVCRLRFTRRCPPDEANFITYDASFDECLQTYIDSANEKHYINEKSNFPRYPFDPKEFEILDRHKNRIFSGKRAVIAH